MTALELAQIEFAFVVSAVLAFLLWKEYLRSTLLQRNIKQWKKLYSSPEYFAYLAAGLNLLATFMQGKKGDVIVDTTLQKLTEAGDKGEKIVDSLNSVATTLKKVAAALEKPQENKE